MHTLKESDAWIPEVHLLAILKGVTSAAYHLQITLGIEFCVRFSHAMCCMMGMFYSIVDLGVFTQV